MRSRWLLAAALVALGVATAPLVPAHEGEDAQARLVVASGDDSPDGGDLCFEAFGTIPVEPGTKAEVTLEVPSDENLQHDVHVAADGFEEGGNTDTSVELNGTDPVEPGGEASFTFTVPEDADRQYNWCDVGAHEARGMNGFWGEADGGSGEGEQAPGPGLVAALAAVALAGGVLRRR
jgi:hypothetical protein